MRLAIWGAFDLDDGTRLATARVIEAELRRRLPEAEVTTCGPEAPEGRFDCLVVCDGDAPEARGPVLSAAEALDGDVAGLAVLLPRMLRPALLERRMRFLRLMDWAWEEGPPVVTVLVDRRIAGETETLAAALAPGVADGIIRVQLAACGRLEGDDEIVDALEAALGGRCRRVPGVASLEDLAALVSTAAAVVAGPGLGPPLATGFGVPATSPADAAGALARVLAGDAPRPDAEAAAAHLDGLLDRLAGRIRVVAGPAVAAPVESAEAGLRAAAHRARGLRLFAERRAHQAALDAAIAELEAALAESRAEAARLRSELAAARAANDQIVGSRTWRYTQPLRDVRARMREGHR